MKTEEQIEAFLKEFDVNRSRYPGMTYEQGVEEALMWAIGTLSEDEFSPVCDLSGGHK